MDTAAGKLEEFVIPSAVLTALVEAGQRAGLPVASWCVGTGVSPAQLVSASGSKVSFRQAAAILKRAVHAMPARPLGMQAGGRDLLLTFGMLGVAMKSCATLAEALPIGLQYHQITGSLVDVEAKKHGDSFELGIRERSPEPEIIEFLTEEALCSTMVFIRSSLLADLSPSRVEFSYAAPSYVNEYHDFFRCPIVFEAKSTRMIFPASLLDLPLPAHHEPTRAVAIDACRRLLELERGQPSVVVAIETLVSRNLREPLKMTSAAQKLNLTERTLRRQLSDAGESFSKVCDRVRERQASFLLRESTMTIDAVAHEVGFSDAREFRRAYKRWCGYPPSVTRSK